MTRHASDELIPLPPPAAAPVINPPDDALLSSTAVGDPPPSALLLPMLTSQDAPSEKSIFANVFAQL